MNLFLFIFSYLGVCAAEFVLIRNALVSGSSTTRFMVKKRIYWIGLLCVAAPVGAFVSSIVSLDADTQLVPFSWSFPASTAILKALFFGAGFTALLSGVKFKDAAKLDVNDLSGTERSLQVSDALRWFVSR